MRNNSLIFIDEILANNGIASEKNRQVPAASPYR
jgi:hypothetical protein